jgi:phospholipid/cholesterol/gamma-HCH transport system ATP-binding protein
MIKVSNLRKSFEGVEVLKGVDLEIPTGSTTAIIGKSGAGKSVLFKHLVGLMRPDSGEVVVDGADITRLKGSALKDVKRKFGMVFQGGALFDSLTVTENVEFPMRELTAQGEREIAGKAEEMLKEVGLPGMGGKYPDEISGGMKKRVALARALVMSPEYLFFDEPTTGLDPIVENAIHALMKKCKALSPCTYILVSHDIKEVLELADLVAMLHEGVIVECSTPDALTKSENPVVKQFLSGSAEGPIQMY